MSDNYLDKNRPSGFPASNSASCLGSKIRAVYFFRPIKWAPPSKTYCPQKKSNNFGRAPFRATKTRGGKKTKMFYINTIYYFSLFIHRENSTFIISLPRSLIQTKPRLSCQLKTNSKAGCLAGKINIKKMAFLDYGYNFILSKFIQYQNRSYIYHLRKPHCLGTLLFFSSSLP